MLSFLAEGGASGALLRAHDWSRTPLGDPAGWPVALKTLVGVMLGANQPMFIAWGPDRTLLYNNGYAPILADRHPRALGRPFLTVWSEIADDLRPLVDRVFAGEGVHMADITLMMNRPGRPDEAHFSFSYTPVRTEDGRVAGMFCACTETTDQVLAERERAEGEARRNRLFDQAPGFMCVLRGPEHVYEYVNDTHRRIFGSDAWIGKPIREVLPELSGQGFFELLDRVYATGQRVVDHESPIRYGLTSGAPEQLRYLNLIYEPIMEPDGSVGGIFVDGYDVTDRRHAEAAMAQSEARLRLVIDGATDHAIFTTDPQGRITSWSRGAAAIFGYGEAEMVGRPADVIFTPEDRAAGRPAWEIGVARADGCAPDERWHLRKDGERVFMNGSVHPLPHHADGREQGFIKIARDETDRRLTADTLGESETRFRTMADHTPVMIWVTDPTGHCTYLNQRWYEFTGQSPGQGEGLGWLNAVHPDDLPIAREAFLSANAEQRDYRVEFRVRRADGAYRWAIDAAAARFGPGGAYLGYVGSVIDIDERREAEVALRESTARAEALAAEQAAILGQLGEGVIVTDPAGRITFVNEAAARIHGVARLDVGPDDYAPTYRLSRVDGSPYPSDELPLARAVLAGETVVDARWRIHRPDGTEVLAIGNARPVLGPDGERLGAVLTVRDDTERDASERALRDLNETLEDRVAERTAELEDAHEALRQAQKMEAVGQLTGGIAHDFNNLLTGVIGSLDLMQRKIAAGRTGEIERHVSAAITSANRAAALTHRLLAFSRRQPLDPRPVDANRLVTSMEELIRRTIGESVQLEMVTAGGLWQTLCDPHQLENAVLNLAINARDAMPEGGKLTIETCNAHLDSAYAARSRDVRPGQYICICVSDTGTGMAKEVIDKAFEPFFTTKPIGQGTGLGLSMIYGFARQSDGYAKIYSEVGDGTTIKIYLPRHYGEAPPPETGDSLRLDDVATAQGEIVLVVEDETAVRDLVVEVLGDLGYRTIEAADGPSGLRLLQSDQRIDLLVTDVGLPGLNGRQVADAARLTRPDLKILFMTGYAENAAINGGFLDPGMELLTKPFAIDALADKIRAMIERG